MTTGNTGPDITVRAFSWDDLPALYDVMTRAGTAPFAYADAPVEAFERSLRQPRLSAETDIFVADSGERLEGWVRVDLEPNIRRAVASLGVDADVDAVTLRPRLLRVAHERAREAGADVMHVPMAATDDLMRMAGGSIGLTQSRVYVQMEYHPAPAYLQGDRRPIPDGFSPRPMDGLREAARLTNLQNAAFEGMWGFAPNNVEEIEASLELPGQGPEQVLFLDDSDGRAVAYVWTKFEPSEGMSVGYVGMVGVHPDYRGRGLGEVITANGIRLLRDQGAGVVKLEVDRDNKPARRIYRDLGFNSVSETIWYELGLAPT
ncbi:MAG: GNAT family N-acetyltransferase [Chloroflexi bacterium]|nr:GNAT family N-acetyltransferase [Chloroflexota bacterium]